MKNYSKQRQLILDTLKNKVDHPTAETLYKDVKNQMPEIGIATVYRNLAALCDAGEVVKLKSKCSSSLLITHAKLSSCLQKTLLRLIFTLWGN